MWVDGPWKRGRCCDESGRKLDNVVDPNTFSEIDVNISSFQAPDDSKVTKSMASRFSKYVPHHALDCIQRNSGPYIYTYPVRLA